MEDKIKIDFFWKSQTEVINFIQVNNQYVSKWVYSALTIYLDRLTATLPDVTNAEQEMVRVSGCLTSTSSLCKQLK